MISSDRPFTLRVYLAATGLVPLIAAPLLKRRLAKGKEDPTRWREKLGEPSMPRPKGTLIWLHGVGMGEVMALRGVIGLMAKAKPDAHFLVTSTTAKGAEAFGRNLPPRTVHQFLPLDTARYRRAFLDHWQPDLCIWTEQDIWPGFIVDLDARGIPQALIGGRMHVASFRKHRKAGKLFTSLFSRLALVRGQDEESTQHLSALGARGATVNLPLKASAPPLTCDAHELARLKDAIGARLTWIVAPSHAADEVLAFSAHQIVLQSQPDALLIVAPRFPDRQVTPPFATAVRSRGEIPDAAQSVFLADTLGELGLFYRLADKVLIGGTHDKIEGHNPWEAIVLRLAVLHGPRVGNFARDYSMLDMAHAAQNAGNATTLAALVLAPLSDQRIAAMRILDGITKETQALVDDLLGLLK